MPAFNFLPFLFFTLFFVSSAHAQYETAPTNVSTGFVRFDNNARLVTWYYTEDGLVVYDDDLIFGTVDEFNQALINITYNSAPGRPPAKVRSYAPPRDSIVKRANSIFPRSSSIWPGGVIYYRYFDSDAENELSSYVDGAIKVWTDEIPCISFVRLPNDNSEGGAKGVVTIKANHPAARKCSASLGFSATSSRRMKLDTGGGCGIRATTHEWGHVLGLIHEHKRPHVPYQFQCKNIRDYTPACCPPNELCGLATNFKVEQDYSTGAKTGATFDTKSIMLYTNRAFAKDNTETLPGAPTSQAQRPSPDDFLRVRELYGCLPPVCSPGCNPTVGENSCHFPTAQDCIYPSPLKSKPRAACACRAGFKATTHGIDDTDVTKQWRLPADEGNFRVWVAEGVECNTPCNVPTGAGSCREVKEQPAECLQL